MAWWRSFGYMLKGIAVASGRFISNFPRNLKIDFQIGCSSLQSQYQWRSISLSPHSPQELPSPGFLIIVILISIRWNLRVVFVFFFSFCFYLKCFPLSRSSLWKIPTSSLLPLHLFGYSPIYPLTPIFPPWHCPT